MLKLFTFLCIFVVGTNAFAGRQMIPIEEERKCIRATGKCPNEFIGFYLYTRAIYPDPYILSTYDITTIKDAPFVPNAPMKILVHGYTGNKDFSPNKEIRPEYLKKGDYNIISVDYGPLVRDGCYLESRQNVDLVSSCLAQLIDMILDVTDFKAEDIHIIAFSLGAQVAGRLKHHLINNIPDRITALDPALPLFLITNDVTSQSATFVDVIHTDALTRGIFNSAGHVDFYVNGGFSQPGCKATEEFSKSSCNHARAPIYFAESINAVTQFMAIKCSNYLLFLSGFCNDNIIETMGESALPDARGVYYLRTRSSSPYALGLNGIYQNGTKNEPVSS